MAGQGPGSLRASRQNSENGLEGWLEGGRALCVEVLIKIQIVALAPRSRAHQQRYWQQRNSMVSADSSDGADRSLRKVDGFIKVTRRVIFVQKAPAPAGFKRRAKCLSNPNTTWVRRVSPTRRRACELPEGSEGVVTSSKRGNIVEQASLSLELERVGEICANLVLHQCPEAVQCSSTCLYRYHPEDGAVRRLQDLWSNTARDIDK